MPALYQSFKPEPLEQCFYFASQPNFSHCGTPVTIAALWMLVLIRAAEKHTVSHVVRDPR